MADAAISDASVVFAADAGISDGGTTEDAAARDAANGGGDDTAVMSDAAPQDGAHEPAPDCLEVPGGANVEDACGTCDPDPENDCVLLRETTRLYTDFNRRTYSVAADRDSVLVSAGSNDGVAPGGVHVLVRSAQDGRWRRQATLEVGLDNELFGYSVALNGDTAIVGAVHAGRAYVFVRSAETWSRQATLAIDGAIDDRLGYSVALSGETALIGAPQTAPGGAVYVFVRDGASWSLQATLAAEDAASAGLGRSIALDGDTAIVRDFGQEAGRALVFTRSGGAWSLQQILTPSRGGRFATAVALHGDTAAVVQLGADEGEPSAVEVFTRAGTVWSRDERVLLQAEGGELSLGAALALSDGRLLVGTSSSLADASGHLFLRSGTRWVQRALLVPSEPLRENFSSSVALLDDVAFVAALQAIDHRGAAYVYPLGAAPNATDTP